MSLKKCDLITLWIGGLLIAARLMWPVRYTRGSGWADFPWQPYYYQGDIVFRITFYHCLPIAILTVLVFITVRVWQRNGHR